MRGILITAIIVTCVAGSPAAAQKPPLPNIVLVVADDMGWRDTGYRGNTIVKTPQLDDMAGKGIQFEHFYPSQQMCSPNRFSIMTGRNPCRTGLYRLGPTRPEELFLPRALKQASYKSAHFGKWHLGAGQTSPVKMGFDQAHWTLAGFDLDPKFKVNDTNEFVQTKGDGSIAVMDLALDYIRKQAKAPEPFLVQVCFGSPHDPHQAAEEFKALYKGNKLADFLGEISGLDAAVGNLRAELRKLGIADNTLVWFVSDNGGYSGSNDPAGRGKYSVGCRTQGLLEWRGRIKQHVKSNVVAGDIDMYPTLLEITGVKVAQQPVVDGVSLMPLIDGKMTERPKPIGFMLSNITDGSPVGVRAFAQSDFIKDVQGVWIDGKYKLIVNPEGKTDKAGHAVALFDIYADQAHKTNLADKEPDRVRNMRQALDEWRRSVRASFDGKDFDEP